jgi:hypothetical protein
MARCGGLLACLGAVLLALPGLAQAGAKFGPSKLKPAVADVPYMLTFKGSGGTEPYEYAITEGELPPGLELSLGGVISGEVDEAMPGKPFKVVMLDSSNPTLSQLRDFELPVELGILPRSLPPARAGSIYVAQLQGAGGSDSYRFSILGGSLPLGLEWHEDGSITGVPSQVGTYSFTVGIEDEEDPEVSGRRTFHINVGLGIAYEHPIPSYTTLSSESPYYWEPHEVGGIVPVTWTIGGHLPPGMSFDAETGAVSGEPTEPGQYTFVVEAEEEGSERRAREHVTVDVAPVGHYTMESSQSGIGTEYDAFNLSGGPSHGSVIDSDGTKGKWSFNKETGAFEIRWFEVGPGSFAYDYTGTFDEKTAEGSGEYSFGGSPRGTWKLVPCNLAKGEHFC